jgi:eukaryotic-like serine/threonine-protein kinase
VTRARLLQGAALLGLLLGSALVLVGAPPARAESPQARRVFAPLWKADAVVAGPCFLSAFMPANDAERCMSWTRRETAGPAFHEATGLVLVGGSDRQLKAFRATNGTLAWSAKTPGAVVAKVALSDDGAYFGTDDGHVLRTDVTSGRVRWDVSVDAEVTEPVVVDGDVVFVVTGADTVYALSRVTGEARWVHKHPLPRGITIRGQARPFVGIVETSEGPRARVYVPHASGRLTILDRTTGQPVDETNLSGEDTFGDLDADPFFQNGRIVVASQTRGVFAIDAKNGAEAWRRDEAGIVRLARGGNWMVVAAGAGKVLGLDARTGQVRWRFTFDKGSPSRIVVKGGRVHVGSDRGSMYVLDLFSGRPLQYIGDGLGMAADPELWGDMLFVVTASGELLAYSSSFPGAIHSNTQAQRARRLVAGAR